MRDLTDRELMQAIRAANLGGGTIRLAYDSGPYEVTKPTHAADLLHLAIVRKFCEVNGLPYGVPVVEATSCRRRSSAQTCDCPNGWCAAEAAENRAAAYGAMVPHTPEAISQQAVYESPLPTGVPTPQAPSLKASEFESVREAKIATDKKLAFFNKMAEREPTEAELVCWEAYEVVGSLLSDLGKFDTPEAEKILDNLSQAKLVHKDVLPWASYAVAADQKVLPNGASIATRLRAQCENIRREPTPLADLIPLMQEAADALNAAGVMVDGGTKNG